MYSNARQKRGIKTYRRKKIASPLYNKPYYHRKRLSILYSFSKPIKANVIHTPYSTIVHREWCDFTVKRALDGWIWIYIHRDCVNSIKYINKGLVTFKTRKHAKHTRLLEIIGKYEYNTWIKIRQILTFTCVLKRKGYNRFHVPKDIVKMIWEYI